MRPGLRPPYDLLKTSADPKEHMRQQLRQFIHIPDMAALAILCATIIGLTAYIYHLPRAASFDMKSPPGLLPAAGLYDIESFPDREGRYRWTNGTGVVKLPNLGGAIAFRALFAAGPERTASVTLHNGDWALRFDVGSDARQYSVLLPPSQSDRVTLHIDSPTVDEGNRALGVLLSDLRLRGGGAYGAVPALVLAALLTSTIGVYALLRRAGLSTVTAAGLVVVAQLAVVVWQNYEGWRYGILSPALLLIGAGSLLALLVEQWWPPAPSDELPPARLTGQDWTALTLLLLLALAVRLPFIGARDPVGDIELSARQLNLVYHEGLSGAYQFGNDYMPLRLYVLQALSLLLPWTGPPLADPLPYATLALLKLPGMFADLVTLALLFVWARRWRGTAAAAGLTALYGLAPPVWINVAWWGQVDAWLMLPMFAAILLLDRAHGRWSWLCWAIALLIKPQAIIIAPLIYSVTVRRYGCRGLAEGGGVAAATLLLGCAPIALAQGGAGGIVQAYVGAVERFPLLTNRAFNLWYLVTWGKSGFDVGQGIGSLSYRTIGLLLTGVVAFVVAVVLLRRSDTAMRLHCGATLALAFFLLPTQIHERYLFLVLAFLALRCASAPILLPSYLVLVATATLNILGTLGGFVPRFYRDVVDSPWPLVAAAINLLVLLLLLVHLLMTMRGVVPLRIRRQVAEVS